MFSKYILRNQKDFSAVYRYGKSKSDRFLVLLYKKNNLSYNRIAFLASKKVGNSVRRSRARRLMREAYRLTEIKITEGYDIVIVARKTINDVKCMEVEKSLRSAIKRTHELYNENNK
ncbi:MAG: ribonuclease P protein component [Clostridiales bacterium]|nr:ribonuclease P protein component [Clostridiales bacterium]